MAVLSEPKRNAYVIKEEYAEAIIKSKMPKKDWEMIRKNAMLFRKNNKACGYNNSIDEKEE